MKRYTFELVIHEGSDEFWEELEEKNKTGCDEVAKEVKELLESSGAYRIDDNCELTLVGYKNDPNCYKRTTE